MWGVLVNACLVEEAIVPWLAVGGVAPTAGVVTHRLEFQ